MKKLFAIKGAPYLLVALVAGILLLLLSSSSVFSKEGGSEETPEEFELCEKRCEERLIAILSEVEGVSEVSVIVTLDELPSSKERPRVRGVAVVCRGAENSDTRLTIVMLISAALGVTSDKIFVTSS